MAHVSILDDAVGGVTGASIKEGSFVTLNASGLHNDLPTVLNAASGVATNVFMAFTTPDRFPRPTPVGMFKYPDFAGYLNPRSATERDLTTDFEAAYLIGPSVLPTFTIPSGWRVACHRGGYYKLLSGEFNDSPQIRVVGAKVMVGANSLASWDAAGNASIGFVREYNVGDGSLTIQVKEL